MTEAAPLVQQQQTAEEYDRVVRADIELFREQAKAYMAGQLTDDQFRGYRLRRGVYGQRQAGVHMIRTKIPGGHLTAQQMDYLARMADEFGGGKGHLTTRQNMQYHFVPLPRVADALQLLAEVRLTTREACYNTVRNVTSCPTSGLTTNEVFDVNPYTRRIAFSFLHRELTDSMPRKFKIALCGCEHDCSVLSIHDAGLKAVIRDGRRGFRMVVGGGLGPLPNEAALLDEFVPEERIVNKLEAVLRVFNKYGNRKNKNKARLKFVLRERGFDWLKEQIDLEYADILANGGIEPPMEVPESFAGFESAPQPIGSGALLPVLDDPRTPDANFDQWLETNVREQRQPGYSIVTVKVDQGNLTGHQMHALAALTRDAADGKIRTTIEQNLILAFVPVAHLRRVYMALKEINLAGAGVREIRDITTCPGAYSCNLALTKSMTLGAALASTVESYSERLVKNLSIKISGCPNSCGQHHISDFGFYGNARKINGREVPYYQMLLGGGFDETGVLRYGFAISSIPARSAPIAVRRVLDHYMADRQEGEAFRGYVLRHKVEFFKDMFADLVKPAELSPDMYKDWGDEEDYSLQLGRGECAA